MKLSHRLLLLITLLFAHLGMTHAGIVPGPLVDSEPVVLTPEQFEQPGGLDTPDDHEHLEPGRSCQ